MKTLEKGRPQTGWSKQCRCTGEGNKGGGCGALLLVEFGDLFKTTRTDYGGDTDVFVTFKCAECGVLTDIGINEPPNLQEIPKKDFWEKRRVASEAGVVLHG